MEVIYPRTPEEVWDDYATTDKFNHQALLVEIWKLSGGTMRENPTVRILDLKEKIKGGNE